MRALIVLSLLWLALSADAHAQSYLDKKDQDAIAAIERSLGKVEKVASYFDGRVIPPGADLQQARAVYDQMALNLEAARRSFNELSAKGMQRPDAQRLRTRYDDLEGYRAAFKPALQRAETEAEASQRKKRDDDRRAAEIANKVCEEFRAELHKTSEDYTSMGVLTNMVDGRDWFWQTLEEGAKFKGALERSSALCKRMPTAGASCAFGLTAPPLDARYCETAAKGAELMKAGVKNLIAFHAKNSGPTRIIKDFDRFQGYLDVDGVIGWTAYFTGAALKERLMKQVAPLLAQANMSASDGDALFASIAAEYAQLEAKARETAPTWELPGAPCSGVGCAQAKKFVQQWYRGSTIKRFQHTAPGWKILTNDFGVPTYRERYGFALVQVKGEPFCQLRMWTYSEQYAGGGRYTPARDVHLHSVRWQSCK